VLSRGETAETGGPRRTRTNDVLPAALSSVPRTSFLGYDRLESEGRVLAILANGASVDRTAEGAEVDLITDVTPFYAEGGGQVGDRGSITADGGRGEVTDTIAHDSGRSLHRVLVTSGELRIGDTVTLSVDATARMMTAANHTATHLLNAALREILGEHVRQAGSLVDPQRLRFDFTHPKALDKSELATIERLVNDWVLADAARKVERMAPTEAIAMGAISLAGEDYGDEVRVLSFGGFSKELCGGTHLDHTSLIGSFRIVSEQSVASGVRRIVAVTRRRAVELTLDQSSALSDVAAALHAPAHELVPAVERLSRAAKSAAPTNSVVITNRWESTLHGVPVTLVEASGAQGGLRKEVQRVSSEGDRVTLLWAPAGDRTYLVVSVPDRYRDRFGADALLTRATQRFDGAGGGNAGIAQGGLRTAPTAESLTKVVTEAIDGSQAG
jgi:alanyl-tRNA synthetase